jgi:hypothetical protein
MTFRSEAPEDPARQEVRLRLEQAGATLLALPGGSGMARVRSNMPDYIQDSRTGFKIDGPVKMRPPTPSAAAITAMDEAFSWISLIPADRAAPGSADLHALGGGVMKRRIVWARALVSPVTNRYLFSWSKLAETTGCDRKALRQWHGDALGLIVALRTAMVAA